MDDLPLTDEQRYPLLNDAGRRMLQRLREHAHAPRWNYQCGDRLTAVGLANVRAYAVRVRSGRRGWGAGELPPWVRELMEFCRREVPFHRRRDDWSDSFFDLPTTGREDLRRQPWAFVPDSAGLQDLIVFSTSGTTGTSVKIPSHPEAASRVLPLIQTALAAHGVTLDGGDRVAIVQVGAQLRTNTEATVMSYLDFAGFAKVNLNPAEWRHPDDRVRFLDNCDPEIYTGDPFAFGELMRLPLRTRPKALVSSATALLPGLRQRLEEHFGCPAIDLYALTEAGPVAFGRGDFHQILPPDLYVETLDEAGRPCAAGERGEVVLTGGINPHLPLLRYRTGDFAALDFSGPLPALVGLEGRAPAVFRTANGQVINSIDVTTALRDVPLPFFALHQSADGSLCLRTRCDARTTSAAERALHGLFGPVALSVEAVPESEAWAGKVVRYSSAVAWAP